MFCLKLEGISKSFGYQAVLKDIDLEVKTGQCCGVIGPNGSGKSTLLKIIAGLLTPSSGKMRYFNEKKELPPELSRSETFWIAPDFEFYAELTAFENLSFFTRMRGRPKIDSEIIQQIEKAGLKKRAFDRVGTFSTGMKQRLKFALALVSQPQILLLDEPGSNLDQQGVEFLDQFIRKTKPEVLMFLATNNPGETKYADFCLGLDQ